MRRAHCYKHRSHESHRTPVKHTLKREWELCMLDVTARGACDGSSPRLEVGALGADRIS